MRVIKEISYPSGKITLFAWNNRYLIKIEQGLFEQTFKINQFDVTSEEEVIKMIDQQFLDEAAQRFEKMALSLAQAQDRIA